MHRRLLGIISVDFDVTDQLVIIHSAFVKCSSRKNGNTVRQYISYLQPMIQLGRGYCVIFFLSLASLRDKQG